MLTGMLFSGLIGALLMFCGDMTLYYNKNDYENDGTLYPIIDIMKKVNTKRLYLGGILGPVSAFVYCVGYFHLVLFMEKYEILGWALFLINCLGIICGGAYHSHCANLGLIGRHEEQGVLDEVLHFLDAQKKVSFGIQAIGFIGMFLVILLGWTTFPFWMAFFTPLVMVLLLPLVRKLPKGLHMVICGGWTNLISVIYYVAALIVVCAGI
ncbi:MAG: hypothetical protein K5682_04135 [Lachnospiraceae bacterium]|nr:hypothetical protein [Lachnospiraceae bacterium]